jgi:hypothetical protein
VNVDAAAVPVALVKSGLSVVVTFPMSLTNLKGTVVARRVSSMLAKSMSPFLKLFGVGRASRCH